MASQTDVERAIPLLKRLATGSDERAAMLRYLDTLAQIAAGTLAVVRRESVNGSATLIVRELGTGGEWSVRCPIALCPAVETLVGAEYLRLITRDRMRAMDADLFAHFFGAAYCANCRYRGARQICTECRYAGEPVNFLPFEPEASPPLSPPY